MSLVWCLIMNQSVRSHPKLSQFILREIWTSAPNFMATWGTVGGKKKITLNPIISHWKQNLNVNKINNTPEIKIDWVKFRKNESQLVGHIIWKPQMSVQNVPVLNVTIIILKISENYDLLVILDESWEISKGSRIWGPWISTQTFQAIYQTVVDILSARMVETAENYAPTGATKSCLCGRG